MSSWSPVVRQLLDAGHDARVVPNLLRSLSGDAAYVRSIVEQIDGPVVYTPYPVDGAEPGTDVSIEVAAFPEVFADGVDPATAQVLAVSQRPLSAAAFGEPASVAAWKTIPSFGIVATGDRAINPEVERFGYKRAESADILELDGPHAVMLTHPTEVAQFVVHAIGAIG